MIEVEVSILIEDVLKRAEVFLGLNDNELRIVAALPSTRVKEYADGEFLFLAGDAAKEVFVVEQGRVEIIAEPNAEAKPLTDKIVVATVNKGSILGWPALVRPHVHVLSAACRRPSRIVAINGAELLRLFEQNHTIGYKVVEGLLQVIGMRYRDLQQILITGKRAPFLVNYLHE